MKFVTLFITIIGFFVLTQNLSDIRVAYKEAVNDKDKSKVEAFYNLLKDINKQNHVALIAYKGAFIALKAKYAETLKNKKEGFIEGATYIEFAIEKEPNAIEPRFIRLGIQENTPKVLKYKDHIDEDKLFLLKQYQYISSENLKGHIKDYILQSKVFTAEEKRSISNP